MKRENNYFIPDLEKVEVTESLPETLLFQNDKVYIIGFKVSDEDSKDNSLPLKQIKEKGYREKYTDKQTSVYLIGITFSKKDRNVSSFEWDATI